MSEALKHAWNVLHADAANTQYDPKSQQASKTAVLVIAESVVRDLNSIATSLDALAKRHGHFDGAAS